MTLAHKSALYSYSPSSSTLQNTQKFAWTVHKGYKHMERAKDQGPQNPVDRPLVTFDTNIIYALRNNEPDALPIRQLLAFNRAGVITINVTLSTALEEQRPDEQME